ncbi:MAG: NADH:ubiquinone reductase (Na(+)-transporting) subunit C [Bacteroidia bacterium]|nr:NADH:ubiquinone reductase (Na(+)-transporting) subunit C [Bacteroidia bacterium]
MSKLNKNSNGYIFGFAFLIIVVCASLLSTVSGALYEKQYQERELERKKFILKSALGSEVDEMEKPAIAELYDQRVKESVINSKGEVQEGIAVNTIDLKKEYKKLEKNGSLKAGQSINLPLYEVKDESGNATEYYVMPTYGFGLWDNIWGYLALQKDLNTVQGFVLDHKGETPGLGARITEDKVQQRYSGDKKIFEGSDLVAVRMMKGEGNDYASKPHEVDGMSGATLTADGVNAMMRNYLNLYLSFINSKKQ